MLMETATEEMGHVEMLATAVAMNLEGAPTTQKEAAAAGDPATAAVLGGMNPRFVEWFGGDAGQRKRGSV